MLSLHTLALPKPASAANLLYLNYFGGELEVGGPELLRLEDVSLHLDPEKLGLQVDHLVHLPPLLRLVDKLLLVLVAPAVTVVQLFLHYIRYRPNYR